ncbi:MAG TPA: choice-of-anchor tandem repeat GloVer-containing protein, partial [Terriglobales bacterium]|nr:choice-of-anchor tandem repeat GloVer-containing protein [Terriglobales bacterium]
GKNASGGWTETILYKFQGGSDGLEPQGGVIFDPSGNLYGTTSGGGLDDQGTVFELSPSGSGQWAESVLYSFQGGTGDGAQPTTLTFDKAGNLFGTTQGGGNYECFILQGANGPAPTQYCGTVFELSPNGSGGWTETVLFKFNNSNGAEPAGPLTFDAAGNLYGTTYAGGTNSTCSLNYSTNGFGCGLVFELSPNGSSGFTESILYSFQGTTDGYWPLGGVIFDRAGNLYGTTSDGGGGNGAVFELSPDTSGSWTETTIDAFPSEPAGENPEAGLVLDQAGNLYGTTWQGGVAFVFDGEGCLGQSGCGTVFELSPNGSGGWTEDVLYRFQGSSDGATPNSELILDVAGNLYGETEAGGSTNACPSTTTRFAGCGVVFEVSKESVAVFAPTSLSFGQQAVGTTSIALTATLTNGGNLPLNIASIQFTGTNSSDFHQTNNCTSSLSPSGSCKISVTFTPSIDATEDAFLSVTDNSPGSPPTVAVSGMGEDFLMSAISSSTATIMPGQTANYTITVAAQAGFNQTVTLTCSGAPAQSTCSLSPSSVNLSVSSSPAVTVTVTTAGNSATVTYPGSFAPANERALWLAVSGLPGLVLLGGSPRKRRSRILCALAGVCLLILVMTWPACGGGGGSSGTGTGTPAGTYNLTVTGSFTSQSTTLSHTTNLTLVVQ